IPIQRGCLLLSSLVSKYRRRQLFFSFSLWVYLSRSRRERNHASSLLFHVLDKKIKDTKHGAFLTLLRWTS
ncbi:hypothetical protein CSUI_006721, partial [Cystoisospora suis]